jgi:hypothetical protein
MPLYTVTVANTSPAELLGALGVPATAWDTQGAGGGWPFESGARAECAIHERDWRDVAMPGLLRHLQRTREHAAFVTLAGKAYNLHSDGEVTWVA